MPVPGLRDRRQLQPARHCGRSGLRVQVVPHLGPVYPQPHAQARGAPSLHRVQPSGEVWFNQVHGNLVRAPEVQDH